jgi:SAM-dependent methyltransferase
MSVIEAHPLIGDYDAKREISYFGNARADYVSVLPVDGMSILELGCGNGATGALALSEGKARCYVGIELFPEMAAEAGQVLTEVHCGDIEQIEVPYGPGTFDGLILSEVLEHLLDPQTVLQRLVRTLKPGAIVLASSPNICHWRNLVSLGRGRFRYTDSGMMDRTHLRWFTPESFRELFEGAGVVVDRLAPLNALRWWERLIMKTYFAPLMYYQINLHGRYRPDDVGGWPAAGLACT